MTTDAIKPIDEQPTKSRRRWFRFSLRSMLLLVVVIAIPLAWKVNRARNQRAVVAELRKLNAQIDYYHGYEHYYEMEATKGVQRFVPPPGGKWLHDLLGREYFVEVIQVTVDGPQVTDDTLALIAKLPEIKYVNLNSAPGITDDGLVHFANIHNLEGVTLISDRISSAGLMHLTGLKRLKKLWGAGWITDASLEQISKLNGLELLDIGKVAQITDKGLKHIGKLHNLRSLCIGTGGWYGEDSGKQDCMTVSEQGLAKLYELKRLETLTLNTTRVTRIGREKLQKALPNCQIQWNSNGPQDSE